MASPILDILKRRVLVLDGAMGTSIHTHDLDIERDYCGCENCTDLLVATRPDVIQGIHETFLEAGADAVETDTFGANRLVLSEFDLTDRAFELNKAAAEIARAACDKFSTKERPRFAIGSMGPGTKLLTLGNTTWDAMLASYREQVSGLLAGGIDALVIETCQDLLQVKCAINGALAALSDAGRTPLDVPIMVSLTIETTGTMLLGTSIEAAVTALSEYPILSLGLNCATGPTEMGEHVAFLGRHWGGGFTGAVKDRYVSCLPNAGLPVLVEGRTEYPLKPRAFAEAVARFIDEHGVDIVGGCCGTTPEHIRELASIVHDQPRGSRMPKVRTSAPDGVASLYSRVEYRQDSSFLIVGERCNASGSKKFKQLLEAEDWDGIVSLAREQVRESAHVLDVNVDYAGRDNVRDMAEVVSRVVRQVDAPLMIDSTQIATVEAGLRHAPGKCIINSANFEDGDEKFDAICQLAKTYNAGLIIGTIDEDPEAAMARTAERKLAIATRGFERATQVHGLKPADVMFDPLVLPVSTGMDSDRRSALELIEGVRAIAGRFPMAQIVVGLSNVSFGLNPVARQVLNSVLLHELVDAGLTSAILHAGKILPQNKIDDAHWTAALDLIHDRRDASVGGTGLPAGISDVAFDPLARFIELFAGASASQKTSARDENLTLEDRIRRHIIDGEKEGLQATIDEALAKYPPLEVINDHLLDGMKTVGELFASGRMQLPFVLQSAEVMKRAVSLLEPHMERTTGSTKGSIVLATVKGDVHDIGKNLVDIILTNNGYTVYNIGIKQPINAIVDKWRETKSDAIGLSGLLVKSVNIMEENLRELNQLAIDVPVVLGGAALTRHYCEGHLRSQYKGRLYYGKDAFEGLRVMDAITIGRTSEIDSEIEARLGKRTEAEDVIARSRAEQASRQDQFAAQKSDASRGGAAATLAAPVRRSDVRTDVDIPTPPFWGARVVEGVSLDAIYPYINPVALFRGQWQFKKGKLSDAEYDAQVDNVVRPVFERMKRECKGILEPKVVYGYFPCNSAGDDLVVFDPIDHDREIERFTFPRQDGRKRLCISDFFRPIDRGERDVVAFHCVTMGRRVSEVARTLFEKNDYTEYLYLHGMGVETAEALAELWHKRIRQELGIADGDSPRVKELFQQHYRGSRYSFGYPACPDMSDQDKLWKLIDPTRIGCVLTENWQIDPEQSTSAIIVHHPEAKYFNV
ncbi:MAG: methionine synthase [Phycisphaerales bacterium]|nr:methionine synthase [Phycisphaerales bacterium]